ncbi:Stk1 family PASTA domain-containing Ser/Thr kinase [Actinoallomurus rhizosphaericola]|uniref:Stk1 family PASTA domain-containing Ser/Thr kinase n=1 Tax=Actinoallomurus rhizosphaericola TaxID=2952536 RepID=UPI00209315F9|nr:Stk1 family PASTA domain-containing Ser/Thr kinase [Actinoallomurus rhizosphaericola]MCO5996536.1 Stk1 family PASTA domain-containing Ser/Thr kinase [Actinoallomurus rhizosphaericola]
MDTTVADPLVGQVLDGRYLVRSRVARGGMATVYAGHDTKLDRTVALKVMHANLAMDEEFVRRFIGEAKSAAALSHPNVVAVYDQGTDKGYVFLAMEYVPGRTLRDLLTERGRLGPREALQVMQPVLSALGAAHRAGLIHRDVKPENVLLTADGQVKVADFGLARAETASKQTKTGMIIGTVGYLAPEQVISGDADARTDVYAAGIMLFELLTGRQPYDGGTPLAVAYKHVNETVPLPSSVVPGLPPQIDALVASATNRDPARRPSDADHFHAAAGEVYRQLPPDVDATLAGVAAAPPPPPAPPLPAPVGATVADGSTQMFGPHPGGYAPPHSGTQMLSPHTMAVHHEPPSPPTMRDRLLRPPGVYGLIAGVLALVLLLGGIVWFQTVGNKEAVPKLAGLTEEQARVAAEKVGLKVKVGSSRYDAKIPKDRVAEVQPQAGTKVDKGTLLTLILSKGKQPVEIPDVRNKPLDQAKQALQQAGLTPGDVVKQASVAVANGSVIKTRPAAGTKQSPDDPITLVVSSGIQMPKLVGLKRDAAAQKLSRLGLNVQWQEQDPGDGQQPNTVINQDPPVGQQLTPGQTVTVTVTKAQKDCAPLDFGCMWQRMHGHGKGDDQQNGQPAPVPGVLGQPIAQAAQALMQSGFQVQVTGGQAGDPVTGQDPPPNTPLPRGSVVKIWH